MSSKFSVFLSDTGVSLDTLYFSSSFTIPNWGIKAPLKNMAPSHKNGSWLLVYRFDGTCL